MNIPTLRFIVVVIGTGLFNALAETNTWGVILFTRYQSSAVYYKPVTSAAVCGRLAANEKVKADFKQGNWFAVFKPSEEVRSISNAVGYMDAQDLFPAPLPAGVIDDGVGYAPPVASNIERMRSIPTSANTRTFTSNTAYQPPSQPVKQSRSSPNEEHVSKSTISWQEIDQIYNLKSKQTNLRKDEFWKRYKGKKIEWTGEVTSVSDSWGGLKMQIKMNPDTFTSDLIITLKKSEKAKAVSLKEGDLVTFRGVLNSWGTLMPTSLNQGEIVR